MDNTSIPNTDDTLLVSSHALQQSTPLQSPNKKRILNDQETIFIETLHHIASGRISKSEEFDPRLSRLPRWQRHLPLGKLTTLDGDPCLGKSILALDIAARVSTGRDMPDGTPGITGGAGVILIAPEDGLADTIHPRLQQVGADLSRIISIGNILTTNPRTGDSKEEGAILSIVQVNRLPLSQQLAQGSWCSKILPMRASGPSCMSNPT
jgi:hypothetical protein